MNTTLNGSLQTRTHNATDQILSVSGAVNPTWRLTGDLASDEAGNTYGYDPDGNHFSRVTLASGQGSVDYRYDAFGRQVGIQRNVASPTAPSFNETLTLWWGDSEQCEVENNVGRRTVQNDIASNPMILNSVVARAVPVISGAIQQKIEHYHKNYLDHVYAVSDQAGNIVESYKYSAFGSVEIYSSNGTFLGNSSANSAIGNRVLWNTRRLDPYTGNYNYLFRIYRAPLGRFITRDPIAEWGGVNLYRYCSNDTLNYWDRYGGEPQPSNGGGSNRRGGKENVRTTDGGTKGDEKQNDERWSRHSGDREKKPKDKECPTPETKGEREERERRERTEAEARRYADRNPGTTGQPVTPPSDPAGDPVPPAPPQPPAPAPAPPVVNPNNNLAVAGGVAAGVGVGYLIYRGVRMLPSLVVPPLWPTIPANVVVP